jgi:hypothetical protein
MTEICDIYNAVVNITDNCEINVMGTDVKTPCVPLCVASMYYAVNQCSYIFSQSQLLDKLTHLLKKCESLSFKENLYRAFKYITY